jgi:hypothetical protein
MLFSTIAKCKPPKRNICRKKYCEAVCLFIIFNSKKILQCLTKYYKESAHTKHAKYALFIMHYLTMTSLKIFSRWLCPSCRGLCCCAACRRNTYKQQTTVPLSLSSFFLPFIYFFQLSSTLFSVFFSSFQNRFYTA